MFRKFVSKNIKGLILFVSGVIVSQVISGWLANIITGCVTLLIVATILTVIGAIYFFSESNQRMQLLVDKMEITVNYFEELHREAEGIPFTAIFYDELTKMVREAKSEILTFFATSVVKGRSHQTDEHPSREKYLLAIEETIIKRHENGFKYFRINQIPPEAINSPASKYLNQGTTDHCRRILELEKHTASTTSKSTLSIMKVSTQMLNSFMIIDRRHIVFGIYGIAPEVGSYTKGIFFFEDRGGKLIERFLLQFEHLERRAQPITLQELAPSESSSA